MHVLSLILAAGYIAAAPPATDLLRVFHDEADRAGLGIWVDVLPGGGALAGETPLADAVRAMSTYVHSYAARYGRHASLRGWYINQELNPLRPGQEPDSSWWRGLWRRTVEEGKRARPGAEVMISPFFLLDEDGLRGFEWLAPEVYRTWWSETLGETGIDILAVQDSGAEHLSLSTIDDRRPMLSAFAQAARDHGRAPWVNVESGHHVADTWPAAVAAEFGGTARWESVPAEVFARKLDLAAELGAQVINWGYFPYQNPLAEDGRGCPRPIRPPPPRRTRSMSRWRRLAGRCSGRLCGGCLAAGARWRRARSAGSCASRSPPSASSASTSSGSSTRRTTSSAWPRPRLGYNRHEAHRYALLRVPLQRV